nr:putative isomerase [Quercus suber]
MNGLCTKAECGPERPRVPLVMPLRPVRPSKGLGLCSTVESQRPAFACSLQHARDRDATLGNLHDVSAHFRVRVELASGTIMILEALVASSIYPTGPGRASMFSFLDRVDSCIQLLSQRTTALTRCHLGLRTQQLPRGERQGSGRKKNTVQAIMSAQLSFVTLDVFTNDRFAGNPLAVVEIPQDVELSTEQMQLMAREFNLSETVFLHQGSTAADGRPEWRMRIFMTDAELPFAGHPTVGTAYRALAHLGDDVAGTLLCPAGRIELPDLATLALVQTSGLKPRAALDPGWDVGFVGSYFYVVTAHADGRVQLRTRMIEGTLEDPATGSAACALSAFLALGYRQRTLRFQITQGVEMGRRSEIGVEVTLAEGLDAIEQIRLSGSAQKVMEGTIRYQ